MSYALNYLAQINVHDCITCGAPLALTAEMERQRRVNHDGFYCPNGHRQYFSGESDAEKATRLAKELAAEKARRVLAEQNETATRASLATARDKLKRVQNGVCPDCRRSFTNLRRHMATKHPHGASPRRPKR